ncbi:uncharacterized protein LOC101857200, partial [Aplysia californica]|uniref:Uncharacterized protein LOC101857200 n=1 Tax=Aplysia californica TaxID=6500 RepID=A0ABM1VYC4_APLCA
MTSRQIVVTILLMACVLALHTEAKKKTLSQKLNKEVIGKAMTDLWHACLERTEMPQPWFNMCEKVKALRGVDSSNQKLLNIKQCQRRYMKTNSPNMREPSNEKKPSTEPDSNNLQWTDANYENPQKEMGGNKGQDMGTDEEQDISKRLGFNFKGIIPLNNMDEEEISDRMGFKERQTLPNNNMGLKDGQDISNKMGSSEEVQGTQNKIGSIEKGQDAQYGMGSIKEEEKDISNRMGFK